MQFGQTTDIDHIPFKLPADHPANKRVLGGEKVKTEIYVGCAKWDRPDWIGKIYPPRAKKKEFLSHYVKQFNSIEVNSTFYSFFSPEIMRRWRDTAPEGFLYCPKFNSNITHIKRLRNAEIPTQAFLESITELGHKLGPCFLQLHENFGPKNSGDILSYLEKLPKDLKVFLEFRHPEWFGDSAANEAFYDNLQNMGFGLVITDTAGRRDCAHMRLTQPASFVRFVGNSLHPTDYKRIDDWVERIGEWMSQGLEQLYFFMHQHDELYSPELVHYFITALNKKEGTRVKVPILFDAAETKLL